MYFDTELDEFHNRHSRLDKRDWVVDDEQNTVKPNFARDTFEKKIRATARDFKPLSRQEELDAVLAAKNNDNIARMKLYWHMSKTIVYLIDHCRDPKKRVEFAELYDVCIEALEAAIRNYDPERGFRFATFAKSRMRYAICRDKDNHFPYHIVRMVTQVEKACANLRLSLKREPELSEIMNATKMTEKTVLRNLELSFRKNVQSLDQLLDESEREPAFRSLSDSVAMDREELMEVVLQSLAMLKRREQCFISLRFGLNDSEPMSMMNIASLLKLTDRGLRYAFAEAFRKLVRNVSLSLGEPKIYQAYLIRKTEWSMSHKKNAV